MCGIVGIVSQRPVNQELFDALTVLQHRGQDAAGIVTCDEGNLKLRKANGLVREVFHTRHMLELTGNIGLGHVRYPTAGSESAAEAQPFYVNSPYGISLAHNGNLTNAASLKKELFEQDLRHINTRSDSEIILNILAHELQKKPKHRPEPADLFAAVSGVHARCRGAYAVVTMLTNIGLLAFRDPHAIRPLVLGQREHEGKTEYMVASESVALGTNGFTQVGDLAPGEAVFITPEGELFRQQCAQAPQKNPCIFEYVYLARPDSVLEGVSVYQAQLNMGEALAKSIQESFPVEDIDVVVPVPETSRSAALSLATTLGVTFREGFVKNRYIGRTFIMPGQAVRKKSVRQKLNAIDCEFKGKNVLLVDDSIVRGTTSEEIIQMVRDAGAKHVYFASACPPIRHPNIYGIDMPVKEELIAHGREVEEVAQGIGADKLFYLSLENLITCIQKENPEIKRFDCAVFDGVYVTGDESAYLEEVERLRSDGAKQGDKGLEAPLNIYNAD